MESATRPTPENITLHEFRDALGRYDQTIEAVSASKSAKPGQKTLAELDRYRYTEAPALFSPGKPSRAMQLEDVKSLVEWKLKHGKFRPTLMKLVASNDEQFVDDTIKSALDSYKEGSDVPAAVDLLTKLKGIGPATASLLLAVHDAENVIFFADEAFYWLCSSGRRDSIKYNAKEYKELHNRSQSLAKRLGVKAVDVERVAYVLMNDAGSVPPTKEPAPSSKKEATKKKPGPAKRKQDSVVGDTSTPRRSKRGKAA